MSNWREESEANVRTESSRSFHEMFGVLKLAGDPQFEPGLGQYNTYIKRPCGKVDECAGFRYTFFFFFVCVCVCVCLPPPPPPPPSGVAYFFFLFFFFVGKKERKKMLQKKRGLEGERKEDAQKPVCVLYSLSRARATAHRDLPHPWDASSSSSHSRIRKYHADHHQRSDTRAR